MILSENNTISTDTPSEFSWNYFCEYAFISIADRTKPSDQVKLSFEILFSSPSHFDDINLIFNIITPHFHGASVSI